MSKGLVLGGNIGCRDKTSSRYQTGSPMESHRVNSIISGEKPCVILYTYISLHAGTPKPQSFLSVWEFRATVIVVVVVVIYGIIWSSTS